MIKSYEVQFLALCIGIYLTIISTVFAQGFIEAIDPLPGDHRSGVRGVSPDGRHVVGWSSNDSTGAVRGFLWREGGTPIVIPPLPGASGTGNAQDASLNGDFVVGAANNSSGNTEAFRWQRSTGTTSGLGFLGTGNSNAANSISDDGQVVAGSGFNGNFQEGWRWTSGGGMQGVGDLPGGDNYSVVEGMSGDGSTVAGWSRAGSNNFGHPIKWSPGGGIVDLGLLPGGYIGGVARGVSFDGSVIVGSCTRNDSTGQTIQAWRWTSGGGMQGLGWVPGAQGSRSYFVTSDGSTVFGTYNGTGINGFFIWDNSSGMRDLRSYLQNEQGIDITGWSFIGLVDISADGKVIVGFGNDPNGVRRGWRVKLQDIGITAPKTGARWVVNQTDTVRWTAPAVQFFKIDLSLDDGQSWQNIDFTTSPGDTMISYQVPDSLYTSDKCRIRVSDLTDSTTFAVSERFTIKGYDLTRVMPDSLLQNFAPSLHSWSYLNSSANMWPPSWWQQFDYANGNDPNTNDRYPSTWPMVPVNAQSSDMPDWPLFVEAFSVDQCYWSTTLSSYKGSAVDYWRTKKRNFLGSCYGFSVSSLLAFNYPTQFLSRNPGIPQADSVNVLFLTNTIRKGINREWVKQYSQEVLDNDVIGNPKTPRDLLHEVKQLFLDETRDGRALSFFNNNASGAHTVLPYRLSRDQSQNNLWRLFVYDSNNPNQFNRFIFIDSTANTWTDSTGLRYGTGSSRCYLEPASGLFLQTLTLGSAPALEKNPAMQLYTGIDNEVLIINPSGQSIGYQDSSDFNTVSGAMAIIPKVGVFSPPIGYQVPPDNYSVTLNEFMDTAAVFSARSGSQIYRYSRSDVSFSQSDQLFVGNGMTAFNPDPAAKNVELTVITQLDSSEREMTAAGLAMVNGDSLDIRSASGQQLDIANYGAAKTYTLQLLQTSAQSSSQFVNDHVTLPANAAHQVVPQWNDLSQPATIYIDLGNNGTIDDSMVVHNQLTGVDEDDLGATNPMQFHLHQNYPNPFNPSTNVEFGIRNSEWVSLKIYDLLGREVKTLVDEPKAAGSYTVQWNGTDETGQAVASGIYLYRLTAGKQFVQTRKMMLLR